jgi:glycosyltransferase EpsH
MPDIEIICVNDGSTDNSQFILDRYAQKDKRIIVINQQNSGVSIARNTGLEHIHGEYYMFVDSDDWLQPETCEIAYYNIVSYRADCLMFSYVKEFGGHSVVNHIFDGDFVWEKADVVSKFYRRLFGLVGKELSKPQDGDIIVSPCMQLFKTSKYGKLRFYDIRETGSFEDGLYQMDLYKDCDRLVYLDKPFYHYRKTNEASITTKYNPKLIPQWQHLFDLIEKKIPGKENAIFYEALNNRICLSLIGIGLNTIKSDKRLINKSKELKSVLQTPRYRAAYKSLTLHVFPYHWRLFFSLAKNKMTLSLVLMLYLMEYMRKHKQ